MADPKFPLTSTGAAMAVATSALRAQQARMRIIAENLANADSTSKTAGAIPINARYPSLSPSASPTVCRAFR